MKSAEEFAFARMCSRFEHDLERLEKAIERLDGLRLGLSGVEALTTPLPADPEAEKLAQNHIEQRRLELLGLENDSS